MPTRPKRTIHVTIRWASETLILTTFSRSFADLWIGTTLRKLNTLPANHEYTMTITYNETPL